MPGQGIVFFVAGFLRLAQVHVGFCEKDVFDIRHDVGNQQGFFKGHDVFCGARQVFDGKRLVLRWMFHGNCFGCGRERLGLGQ